MEQIYNRINNHEFLSNRDIARFIHINSNGNIRVKFITSDNSSEKAFYDPTIKSVLLDINYKTKSLKYLCEFSKKRLKILSDADKSKFLVDAYNLKLICTLFHELRHAKQMDSMSQKSSCKYVNAKKELIYLSYIFAALKPKDYKIYHDLYYHEYDAVINSFIRTLNIIDKCQNLSEDSVIEFNRFISAIIYHSHGNRYPNGNEPLIFDSFKSPIVYSKHLSSSILDLESKKLLLRYVRNLKENSTTEYLKLVNGLKLSDKTLNLLHDTYARIHSTSNLLNEIKIEQKVKIKVK